MNVGVSLSASVLSILGAMRSDPVAQVFFECGYSSTVVACVRHFMLLLNVFHLWVWANAFVWYGSYVFIFGEY